MVPDRTRLVEGESTERVPLVVTVTPVKLPELPTDTVMGVTAAVKLVLWDSPPPVPVTLIVYSPVGVWELERTVRVELADLSGFSITWSGVNVVVGPFATDGETVVLRMTVS